MYRYDADLVFLNQVSDQDLDPLVNYLIRDEDGNLRFTEELTDNDLYKNFAPRHSHYWREIAAELQCFGGNTFMTLFRGGQGVLYREILTDVCDKMDVPYSSDMTTQGIEQCLLTKLISATIEEMSQDNLRAFVHELELNTTDMSPQAVIAALQTGINLSGFMFYKVSVIVANAVAKVILGSGLSFATNAALTRVIGIVAGPIGWILTGIWTALDIAGPAYRYPCPTNQLRQKSLVSVKKSRKTIFRSYANDII